MKFDQFNWEKTTENWEKWWSGDLGRPVFYFTSFSGSARDDGGLPIKPFTSQYDFSIPAEEILLNYENKILRNIHYYGDAFPAFWPNFGPGVLPTFAGGEGHNHASTVWYSPGRFEGCELKDIEFKLDKSSPWFRRIEEFFTAAAQIWKDRTVLGMTDLGGTLDIIASLRPGEKLLLDLYDNPDEVKRLIREVHDAWWEAYAHFENLTAGSSPGYSAWTPLLSKSRYYMLQCDFSYMISPDMFEEFVKPELADSCRRLSRAFYHLDGKGELPHLKHLCSIPELAGIQWIPGDGMPPAADWPEVLREIVGSGRKLQVFVSSPDDVEKIISCLEKPEAVAFIGMNLKQEDEKRFLGILDRYGA